MRPVFGAALSMVMLQGVAIGTLEARPPVPASELEAIQGRIDAASQREKNLKREAGELKQELSTLQKESISLAKETRKVEQRLLDAEAQLDSLNQEEKRVLESLKEREEGVRAALAAMVRLGQVPPEAVLAMPGQADEIIRTAGVLETVLGGLETEASALRADLEKIRSVRAESEQVRAILAEKKEELATQLSKQEATLTKRQKVYSRLNADASKQRQAIAALSKKSNNLQELIRRLEQQRKAKEEAARKAREAEQQSARVMPKYQSARPAPASRGSSGLMRHFSKKNGSHLLQPVPGKIIKAYGDKEAGDSKARGITIATRPGAQVMAPWDGEIVYTGPFLSYGNILIIRHSDTHHTLVAGLARIDASVGQFVLEGEPVGAMGSGKKAELYMELRERSKPIDPKPWLAG